MCRTAQQKAAPHQDKDRSHRRAPTPNLHVAGSPPKKRMQKLHTGSEKLKNIYHQHKKKSLYGTEKANVMIHLQEG